MQTTGFRRIADDRGIEWEVWEAHPRLADRRLLRDRRAAFRPEGMVRRTQSSPQFERQPGEGWLVFRSSAGERRRRPIAEGWEQLATGALRELLASSRSTGPFPRVRQEG